MICMTRHPSPLGPLTLASDGEHLIGLWLEGQKYFAATIDEAWVERTDLPVFGSVRTWLDRYFAGGKPDLGDVPLAPRGGAFRQAVWDVLRRIPYGTCATYGGIARTMAARLHRPSMSSQAVGGAVGHNPIAIIIPCHRVVGADGSLTGYAGGIGAKIALLEREGVDLSRLSIPRRGTALHGRAAGPPGAG